MGDLTTWIIALVFYAPVHYLGPALVGFLTGDETSQQRHLLLKHIAIDCTLSLAVAFAIAAPLYESIPQYAAAIFLLAMFVPYLRLWQYRRRLARGN
jgi:hypothetical protein